MKSLKKKIVGSAVTLAGIGSLLVFGISSYAWFLNNQVSDGYGPSVKIDLDTNLVDINFKLYKYDRDEKSGVEFNEGSEGFDLVLNDFDNFIRERNINNNNIIRFHVSLPNSGGSTAEERNISVSAKINSTVIGESFNGGFDDTQARTYNDESGYFYHNSNKGTDYICNNISNVIYFKGFTYTYTIFDEEQKTSIVSKVNESINIDETSADTIYKTATKEFEKISEQQLFVGEDNKSTEINFTMEKIPAKSTELVFFVEYNYSIDLIDKFLVNTENVTSAHDSQILANKIDFMKDIESIRISSSEVR